MTIQKRLSLLARRDHPLDGLRVAAGLWVLVPLALPARLNAVAPDLAPPALDAGVGRCDAPRGVGARCRLDGDRDVRAGGGPQAYGGGLEGGEHGGRYMREPTGSDRGLPFLMVKRRTERRKGKPNQGRTTSISNPNGNLLSNTSKKSPKGGRRWRRRSGDIYTGREARQYNQQPFTAWQANQAASGPECRPAEQAAEVINRQPDASLGYCSLSLLQAIISPNSCGQLEPLASLSSPPHARQGCAQEQFGSKLLRKPCSGRG
jgi:hypothetical protein